MTRGVAALAAGLLALLAVSVQTSAAQSANGAGAGETVVATHGDWRVACSGETGRDCFMVQVANSADGTPLVEISIVPLTGDARAVAGATAIVPLGTALPEGLTLQTDTNEPLRYVYDFCAPTGCVANIALTPSQMQAMRAGAATRLTLAAAARPDEPVTAILSLSGFTAAYAALEALQGR
jgi:invasion protein IalB